MIFSAGLMALGWLLLGPEPASAWGPGTHVALGEMVLASLHLVPPAVKAVLERHPVSFLYGSIAADISFGKKYVPEGRHCHHWHVGEEILASADSEALKAVGYGYLAHLAADTVAHNLFVPRRLLLTSTTQAAGHTYWEHRMDVHVGDDATARARQIVLKHDHSDADALFDDVLSATIFSFQTNRRIFRGIMQVQGDERWIQVFERILAKSRFDLPPPLVRRYLALSFDYVVDYLVDGHASTPYRLDPIGDLNLRLAKKVRRRGLAEGAVSDPEVLPSMADEFFPLPDAPLVHWPRYRLGEGGADGGADDADVPRHAPELPTPGIDDDPAEGSG